MATAEQHPSIIYCNKLTASSRFDIDWFIKNVLGKMRWKGIKWVILISHQTRQHEPSLPVLHQPVVVAVFRGTVAHCKYAMVGAILQAVFVNENTVFVLLINNNGKSLLQWSKQTKNNTFINEIRNSKQKTQLVWVYVCYANLQSIAFRRTLLSNKSLSPLMNWQSFIMTLGNQKR